MTLADPPLADTGSTLLYQQIQQFYADQMHLLDTGRAEEWAETFTEDGVFAANAHPEAATGRSVIAAAARTAVDDYAARRIQRRHWLGMVSVTERNGGEVAASCYALVIETPRGGRPELRASTSCDDVLVRQDGRWLVRERRVRRDDLD